MWGVKVKPGVSPSCYLDASLSSVITQGLQITGKKYELDYDGQIENKQRTTAEFLLKEVGNGEGLTSLGFKAKVKYKREKEAGY